MAIKNLLNKIFYSTLLIGLSFAVYSDDLKRIYDPSVYADELDEGQFISKKIVQSVSQEAPSNLKKELYFFSDSIVILNKNKIFNEMDGLNTLGNFMYATDPETINKYKNELLMPAYKNQSLINYNEEKALISSSTFFDAVKDSSHLKIAFDKNKPDYKFISNGRLIIEFSNVNNIIGFDKEYDIKEVYNQSPFMIYEVLNLIEINNIISAISNDVRIKSLDLDKVVTDIGKR